MCLTQQALQESMTARVGYELTKYSAEEDADASYLYLDYVNVPANSEKTTSCDEYLYPVLL